MNGDSTVVTIAFSFEGDFHDHHIRAFTEKLNEEWNGKKIADHKITLVRRVIVPSAPDFSTEYSSE